MGISDFEIDQFEKDFLLKYLKFHHPRKTGHSSILFLGFNEEELNLIKKDFLPTSLEIKVRVSQNLTFLCVKSNFKNEKRISIAKKNGTFIINENEFYVLFNKDTYDIELNSEIYPQSITKNLRIVKPLSNFNETIQIESFSFDSDRTYSLNLYNQTCTCNEFVSGEKEKFEKGDLRRLCRHLIFKYKRSFSPKKLTPFKRFLFDNQYSLKEKVKQTTFFGVDLPVYFSYDNRSDWCDIFFPTNNIYKRYSFNIREERFSYNDKPYGYVKQLRQELEKHFRRTKVVENRILNKGENQFVKYNSTNTNIDQNTGCIAFLIIIIALIIF